MLNARIFVALFCVYHVCAGQSWQAIDTIDLQEQVLSYSIDSESRIYIGTATGNLYRYDPSGEESEFFSAVANSPLTSVAAWNRLKVFLFYEYPQEFYLLDRFNTFSSAHDLREYADGLINYCTPGTDNSLWTLGSSYNELGKFNMQTGQELFSNPLSISLDNISHMRAFQNLLIISDRQEGILFFDQFGNLLSQVEYKDVDHFQIEGERVVFYADQQVVELDPFSQGLVKKTKAPEGAFIGVLKYEKDFFFIMRSQILVFKSL